MARFLIGANLPYKLGLWHSADYIHQFDLGDSWSDDRIWNYTKQNNLTIVTKDADFSSRIILSEPPPKVIHLRVGNMKLNELFEFLNRVWEDVLHIHSTHKLVNVFHDQIEGIN